MLTKFQKGTGSFAGLLHHNHSNVNHHNPAQQHTNLAFMRKAPSNFKSLGMLNGTQLSNQHMSAAGGKMLMLHPSSNHNMLDQRHPSQPFSHYNKSLRPMSAAQQTTIASSGHFRVTVDMDQQ